MKKIISLVLTALMILSIMPMTINVSAADRFTVTGITNNERYLANDGITRTVTVTDANAAATRVEFSIDNELKATDSTSADGFTFVLPSATENNSEKTLKITAYDGETPTVVGEYAFTVIAGTPGTTNIQNYDDSTLTVKGSLSNKYTSPSDPLTSVTWATHGPSVKESTAFGGNALKFPATGDRYGNIRTNFTLVAEGASGANQVIQGAKLHERLIYVDFDLYRENNSKYFTFNVRQAYDIGTATSFLVIQQNDPTFVAGKIHNIRFIIDTKSSKDAVGVDVARYYVYHKTSDQSEYTELKRGETAFANFNANGLTIQCVTYDNVAATDHADWIDNVKSVCYAAAPELEATPLIEDRATSIPTTKTAYRINFSNNLKPNSVTNDAVVLKEDGTLVVGTTVTQGTNYVDLVFPSGALQRGPAGSPLEYSVTIQPDSIADIYGALVPETTYTFSTVCVGENLVPEPELTISAADEGENRYFPENPITLSATVVDEDGDLESLEFRKDGEVIEGSLANVSELTQTGTNPNTYEYSFVWNAPESASATTLYNITAVATDTSDEGTSLSKAILVYGHKAPTVSVSAPETVYSSIAGLKASTTKITGAVYDLDGNVVSVDLYLNNGAEDTHIATVTPAVDNTYSYIYTGDLSPGEFTIRATATDDTVGGGLTASATTTFAAKAFGIQYPAFQTEDLTLSSNTAKWIMTGEGNVKLTEDVGLVFTQSTAGDASITRDIGNSALQERIWVFKAGFKFGDATHNRAISLAGNELIILSADGKILTGSTEKGTYSADEQLNLTYVANTESGLSALSVNGTVIYENKDCAATAFANGAQLKLTQTGTSSETKAIITDYALYNVGDSASGVIVKVDDALTNPAIPLAGVSATPQYITIDMEGGIGANFDLANSVELIDDASGKNCALSVEDGKVKILEQLISGSTYTIKVTDACNVQGLTYAGVYSVQFTTLAEEVMIDRSTAGIIETTLTEGSAVNFSASVSNTSGESKNLWIICAVYDGNKMIDKTITPVTVAAAGGTINATSPVVTTLTPGTVVEVFVSESADYLQSFSKDIFKLD